MDRSVCLLCCLELPSLVSEMSETGVKALHNVLPETWTHVDNLNLLHIGFAMKLAGIDWRTLPEGFARMEHLGLIQRNGYTIRRTPLGSR